MTIADTFSIACEAACRALSIRALKDIPTDVRAGLQKGYDAETQAEQKTASKVMLTVLENIKLADEKDMMVCQDTGLPIYKVLVGQRIAPHIDLIEIKNRIKIACERATKEHPLRSNT